jgi:DNA polymerase III delta prime subunit
LIAAYLFCLVAVFGNPDLIPQKIEGFKPQVNRIRSTDLNSSNEVYSQFTRNKAFDNVLVVNNQKYNFKIIEVINFDVKARDAFRVVLDEYRGVDMTIMTTNQIAKIDIGVRSRCETMHVQPCDPQVILPRAKSIIDAEDYVIDDDALMAALEAAYEAKNDNRRYYQTIDEILRKA